MDDAQMRDEQYPYLQQLYDLLDGSHGLQGFLTEITTAATEDIAPVLSCGLTVRVGGESLTQSSSDNFARRLDEIQYQVDDGPCLHALRTGRPVTVTDLACDSRWPAYRQRGEANGLGATLAVPMIAAGQPAGALNLYSKDPHRFDEQTVARAQTFAHQAAGAVALASRLTDRLRHSADLEAALSSRTTIDQALGIIMDQQRCTVEQAFEILSRHSQNTNTKLRDLAGRIVRDVSGQEPQSGPSIT